MKKAQSYSSLTKAELLVLKEISNTDAEVLDIPEIAKSCNLSEVQTAVALQLLQHKNAIPHFTADEKDA